jgi:hypothetical protein
MHVIRGDNLKPDAEGQDELDMADDDLFVRDDEAGDAGQKRKRGGGEGDEEEEADEEEREREQSPTWKAKKTKQFARQQDYISFADEQGLQEEDESEEEEESGAHSGLNDDDDHGSVHSDSSIE